MDFLKNNQRVLALVIGHVLVAGLFFNLGRFWATTAPPDIQVEEPAVDLSQTYDNAAPAAVQPAASASGVVQGQSTALDCTGKIKGNISSSGKIYHLPGGVFYDRTNPEICFDTEVQAQAAGFRKSQR